MVDTRGVVGIFISLATSAMTIRRGDGFIIEKINRFSISSNSNTQPRKEKAPHLPPLTSSLPPPHFPFTFSLICLVTFSASCLGHSIPTECVVVSSPPHSFPRESRAAWHMKVALGYLHLHSLYTVVTSTHIVGMYNDLAGRWCGYRKLLLGRLLDDGLIMS